MQKSNLPVFARFRDALSIGFTGGTFVDNAFVSRIVANQKIRVSGAEVFVYDRDSGVLAWRGKSHREGRYKPHFLAPGVEYFIVAVDSSEYYEAIASGPVVAVAEDV